MGIRLRDILLSWDFILAACITAVAGFGLANDVKNDLEKDIYNVGISVLAIVFSVYFAALAIIISSSDDEFVKFLEEVGDYGRLISTFRYSLAALFLALMYSLSMYTLTSIWLTDGDVRQEKWFLIGFAFLFPYSLFAAVSVTSDAIQYAKSRSDFLRIVKRPDDK